MIPSAVTSRNADEVNDTVAQLQQQYPGVKVMGVIGDATKLKDLERLVQEVTFPCGYVQFMQMHVC